MALRLQAAFLCLPSRLAHLLEHVWGAFLSSSSHGKRFIGGRYNRECMRLWGRLLLTGEIEFLLPVILAIVLSNWVAHHIHSAGAYESDLERIGGIHFLQSEPSQRLHLITVRDIMAPDVICFNETTSVAEVVGVLRQTCHNGFPVIRHTNGYTDHPNGQIVCVMLRRQILLLLEQRAFLEIDTQMLHCHGSGNYLQLPRLKKEHRLLYRLMHV